MNTALRPMSTGEVLDRTFNLYRRNFMLFFGIALLPPALMLLVQLAPLGMLPLDKVGASWAGGAAIAGVIGVVIFFIAWVIGYAVAQAATVFAVSAVHLGYQTSISQSYSQVRGRYGRVLNVILSILIRAIGGGIVVGLAAVALIAASSTLLPRSTISGIAIGIVTMVLMVAAVVITLYYFLRYAVAVPACVLEDIKARDALKRSVHLTKNDRGRIFVIYFLVGILNYILAIALVFPAVMLGTAIAGEQSTLTQILNALAGFLAGALIGPIATIALSLVYYDERVRKEAFDLELMMTAAGKPVAGAVSAATT